MTSTVTQLTHYVDISLIARLFMRFKGRYGTLWTSRASSDEEWEFIMDDWLQELSRFTIEQVRSAVNKALSEFTTYPPTLGQLIELCLKESGVPAPHDVIRLMVARDFSHPLVKMIYDKVGSWTLTNGKADEIERKVKEHYQAARSDFYLNPQTYWDKLISFNQTLKLEAPEKKQGTPKEHTGLKERLAEYQAKLAEEKSKCEGKTYREFDKNKINPRHKEFDKAVYEEFKAYLLAIPENNTLTLPTEYIFERRRFIGAQEQKKILSDAGFVPPNQRDTFQEQRSYNNKPTKMYKNWDN